jgi:O-antigen ligase
MQLTMANSRTRRLRAFRRGRFVASAVVVGAAGTSAALLIVHGNWALQAVAALAAIGLLGVAVAMLKGFSFVDVYCITAIWISVFASLLRDVSVGPMSALGAVTVVFTIIAATLWLMSREQRGLRDLWPLVYFAVLGLVYLVIFPRTVSGIQSVLAVLVFVLSIVLVASSVRQLPTLVPRLKSAFNAASWVAVAIYGATIALFGFGNDFLLGPRGFALFALIPITWSFARWRYGDRRAAAPGLALLGVVVLSLSRLATAIGFLFWPLSRMSSRAKLKDFARVVIFVALGLALFFVAFQNFTPLRDRFLTGDVANVGGILDINVSGRDNVWPVVWHSALRSPWIGQGAGSAEQALIGYGFKVSLPHNEYLRIFHDFGLLGLVLWLWGFFLLLMRTYRAWRRADGRDEDAAIVHLAAWLGLVGLGLSMITDNPLRYVHVLLPLGITLGASVGLTYATGAVDTHNGDRSPQMAEEFPRVPNDGSRVITGAPARPATDDVRAQS